MSNGCRVFSSSSSSASHFESVSHSASQSLKAAKLIRYFAYAAPTPSHLPPQSVFGAASSGACRALHQYILEDEFALDERADVSSATPLMYAVQFEQDACVELLLDSKSCVNLRDNCGKTALHYAAASWNVSVVRLLIAARACVLPVDKDTRTCLHAAACGRQRCPELASGTQLQRQQQHQHQQQPNGDNDDQVESAFDTDLLRSRARETTRLLAASNQALINAKDYDGRSALHFAASNARSSNVFVDVVETLLEFKASPNCCDVAGSTPLHYMCDTLSYSNLNKSPTLAAVQALLDAKANLCTDSIIGTPLNIAALAGDVDLVTILLKNAHDASLAVHCEFPVHNALAAASAPTALVIANATPNPLWTAERARPFLTMANKFHSSISFAADDATRLEFRDFLVKKYRAHFAVLIQHTARTKQKLPRDVLGCVAQMLLPPPLV